MISVVVATLDRPLHVARCVRSVLAGDVGPGELIVVDQSDGDGVRRALADIADPRVRVVHQAQRSASLARNRGVELAASEYVAVLDDDAEVGPSWLADIAAALLDLGEPDALFGAIDAPPEAAGRDLAVSTHAVAAPVVWPATAHPARPGFGGHMVIRRTAFRELGGFDERLGPGSPLFGAEDIDLNYRLLRSGRTVASTPAVRMVHHQWRDDTALPRLMYGYNLGHSAFCAKHLRQGDLGALRLVARQALDDVRMLASAIRRRSWLRARVAGWRARGTARGLLEGWRRLGPRP
ncbi:MAG: hypothetical protein QOE28_2319 [Solirubrobacteraceae bacterium]|nr:hypothetical protein [Solirubrobacteraceae bacterium]